MARARSHEYSGLRTETIASAKCEPSILYIDQSDILLQEPHARMEEDDGFLQAFAHLLAR